MLVMRDGSTQQGRFVNMIGGDTLLWDTAAGARQQYAIRDVSRVYLNPGSARTVFNAVAQATPVATTGQMAAVQVRVDFANGMSINFHNNWITPADFEGPVNQGHEIVGADGKVESDQQYRGFRWWNAGARDRSRGRSENASGSPAKKPWTRAMARAAGPVVGCAAWRPPAPRARRRWATTSAGSRRRFG